MERSELDWYILPAYLWDRCFRRSSMPLGRVTHSNSKVEIVTKCTICLRNSNKGDLLAHLEAIIA